MGFSLQSDSGKSHRLEDGEWRNLLKIARRYGWEPMGTEPNLDYLNQRARNPDGGYDQDVLNKMIETWNGSYLTRERQYVSYADALNIAFALEDAVRDRGIEAEYVRGFISFCKMGRFSIG